MLENSVKKKLFVMSYYIFIHLFSKSAFYSFNVIKMTSTRKTKRKKMCISASRFDTFSGEILETNQVFKQF